MELREAVATRFSCRSYLDKPVPESIVRAILECAVRAPSGGDLQPWSVDVLARDRRPR
jgi:nitroreductase